MESAIQGLDLEKELTCSICTEVLFQPLTLLDCLHTFCGCCLKEWFSWQLTSSRTSPNSLAPGATPYTCPSCRAPVRDTRPNATVTTLLEMFLAANPDKVRTIEEKEEISKKYTPGDDVLPKVEAKEKSLRERRVEDEDRRLMNEVTALSLREAGVETSEARRERRRREDSRSHGSRSQSSRDNSRDHRSAEDRERRRRREAEAERRRIRDDISLRPAAGPTEDRRRRRSDDERRRTEDTRRSAARQIEHQSSLRSLISSSDVDSHEMEEEILRQIREEGLLDGIDLENIDVNQEDQISERIAEAFRRRQNERSRQEPARRSDVGARNGVNRPAQQTTVSATESRETSGDDTTRVNTARRHRTHSRSTSITSQSSERRAHSRSTSALEQSRPPPAMSAMHATHLDVNSGDEGSRRRRRTLSENRSATTPVPVAEMDARPATRSQTDLSNRPQSYHSSASRPLVSDGLRSSTDPAIQRTFELPGSERTLRPRRSSHSSQSARTPPNSSPRIGGNTQSPLWSELPANSSPRLDPSVQTPPRSELPSDSSPRISTSSTVVPRSDPLPPNSSPRIGLLTSATMLPSSEPGSRSKTRPAPSEIYVPSSQSPVDRTLLPAPLSPRLPDSARMSLSDRATAMGSASRPTSSSSPTARSPTQLYPEPSLTCARCAKTHIEYDLHYNCNKCHGGNFNICLSCYRSGKGCLHWFGFGYAAWRSWEARTLSGEISSTEKPHMLTASRYVPPKYTAGGADGRKTLTSSDPQSRLQSGAFCASCLAWANECYWRCESCNEGDWGFCNNCVNQGKSCTHSLLPLTYKPSDASNLPLTPTHDQQIPASARILTGPGVLGVGNFKPLTFHTSCDICRHSIQPTATRFHCFFCISKAPNTFPGDYDICTNCYPKLVTSRRISSENGHNGWRRCLQGHRMVSLKFEECRGGECRVIVQDLVGGRSLVQRSNPYKDPSGGDLQIWGWGDGKHADNDGAHKKLVTSDVMKTAPTSSPDMPIEKSFPPDGGVGQKAQVFWSWYPAEGADDELLFPKGAEIREVKDVNGDWFHGSYMGKTGLFPSPYVRILDKFVGS